MKRIFLIMLCNYFISAAAQTLTPVASTLFKEVKTTLTNEQKNVIAKSTALTIAADKSFESDGMPVNGVWVYPTDLNKDGNEEIFVVMSSTELYGNTGQGFTVFFKNAAGNYMSLVNETGVPGILKLSSLGYPDILVGGPGFGPMPVLRWNGKTYTYHRDINTDTTPNLSLEDVSAAYTKTLTD